MIVPSIKGSMDSTNQTMLEAECGWFIVNCVWVPLQVPGPARADLALLVSQCPWMSVSIPIHLKSSSLCVFIECNACVNIFISLVKMFSLNRIFLWYFKWSKCSESFFIYKCLTHLIQPMVEYQDKLEHFWEILNTLRYSKIKLIIYITVWITAWLHTYQAWKLLIKLSQQHINFRLTIRKKHIPKPNH